MAANEAASESETAWEKVPKSETEASKREASEAETSQSWDMLTDTDAKKLKLSESESDAAGLPLEMPKVCPSEPPLSREEYAAGRMPKVGPSEPPPSREEYEAAKRLAVPKTLPKASPKAAGPAPAPFLLPESEKEFSLGDLKDVVTSLAALDACLVHFSSAASSKNSTPEGTLDPAPVGENAGNGDEAMATDAVSEADYGGEGDEENEAKSWEELGAKHLNASPEALKRLTELLGQHKTNLEKLLEQQESKEKAETAAGEVFNALMRQEWDSAAALIDYSGLTLLHHAVRSFHLPLILQIVEKCPGLANRPTAPNRQPGHWTPLMIFCNLNSQAPNSQLAENEKDIGYLLCQHMSLDGLNVRGTTYCTATHIAVPRSKWSLVKNILYRISDLGGKGRSVVDIALSCNLAMARYLQEHWQAEPAHPPPARWDLTAYRPRNQYYDRDLDRNEDRDSRSCGSGWRWG
ncbi:unnamed protein product [Cladocopium goreaui]|uniref:Uncharacterized protein n=1 Tax=Cladocopium goreaui TaxID=2562237 RepID=A0A9P1C0F8_9DINO|nr:unnamed protein product [Cladocopium goreaui]